MRFLIFALFLFMSQSLFGQITFEPTFINQCSNKIDTSLFWSISNFDKTYEINNLNGEKVALPDTGIYQLHLNRNYPPIELIINKKGTFRDTFFTKRIFQKIFIGSHTEYLDCGNLADGKISDDYFNGNKRRKGVFKNGQPTDTLFSYYRNGQLREMITPRKKNWKKINYFKNGKIKSIYDVEKHYEKEFYSNGQLKKERNWSRKNKPTRKEYFPNGILKSKQNHKKLKIYNQDKVVVEKMKRKEILIFERIFKKKKHGRDKFYEYKWESFDDRGIIKRKIIFDNDHFKTNPFPESVQQIDDFLFEYIIFYFNGKEFKKVVIEYDLNNNFSKKLVLYGKEGKKWVKEKTTSTHKIYEMIENYTN